MIKRIITCLIIFVNLQNLVFCNNPSDSTIASRFSVQLNNFRNETQDSIVEKFTVYVVDVHKFKTDSMQFLLTYILNSDDFDQLYPTYFSEIGNNFVLWRVDYLLKGKFEKTFQLKKLDFDKRIEIVQRLIPSVVGGYKYSPPVWLWEFVDGKENVTEYKEPWDVPQKFNLWLNKF